MDVTVYLELGNTEYELEVEYYPGEGVARDYPGAGAEVRVGALVRYSNNSGWEVTTYGNFLLDYANCRDLGLHDAARALDDQCAELAEEKMISDFESRWDT